MHSVRLTYLFLWITGVSAHAPRSLATASRQRFLGEGSETASRTASAGRPRIPPLGAAIRHSHLSLSVLETLERLRGGSDTAVIAQDGPIQSLVRSLLEAAQQISPGLATFIRSLISIFEKTFGLQLQPAVKAKPTGKRNRGATRKSTAAATRGNIVESKRSAKESTSKKTKRKRGRPTSQSSQAEPRGGKQLNKPIATKPSGARKHLDTNIKSSSPNYRIQKELKNFIQDPPTNLSVKVGKNIRIWIVTIVGAKGSIYEGETFQLRIQFPPQYPTVPPSVYFLPPHIPLHEHVYTNGDICLSLLGKDWRPTMTAQSIAVSIQSILNNALRKELPMDNAQHAHNKPGQFQKDWVYHDDNC